MRSLAINLRHIRDETEKKKNSSLLQAKRAKNTKFTWEKFENRNNSTSMKAGQRSMVTSYGLRTFRIFFPQAHNIRTTRLCTA